MLLFTELKIESYTLAECQIILGSLFFYLIKQIYFFEYIFFQNICDRKSYDAFQTKMWLYWLDQIMS